MKDSHHRYEVNAKTEIAKKFPTSPLENHHLEVYIEIISKPEFDIFKNVDTNRRDSIRKVRIIRTHTSSYPIRLLRSLTLDIN